MIENRKQANSHQPKADPPRAEKQIAISQRLIRLGRKSKVMVLLTTIVFLFSQNVIAQEAKLAPGKVKLQAVLTPPYILGPGDQLTVIDRTLRDVFGQAEQYNVTISSDGYISIPLPDGTQENILAAGLTLDELSTEVRERFSKTLRNPLVFIQVFRYRPINVYIGGEIVKPGVYKVESTTTSEKGGSTTSGLSTFGLSLTEAIQLAGGLRPRANIKSISITRGSSIEKKTINLKALLTGEEFAHDLNLQPGDVIHVPATDNIEEQAQTHVLLLGKLAYQEVPVNVVGEAKNASAYILPNDATLLDAIGMAGGLNNVGTLKKIRLSRYDEKGVYKTTDLNIHDLLTKGIFFDQIALKPNDTIELIPSKGKETRRFFRDVGANAISILVGAVAGSLGGFIVQDSFVDRQARLIMVGGINLGSGGGGGGAITIIGGNRVNNETKE